MRTAAILPVKRFDRAKSRLGASVADPLRGQLARAMVADVLRALAQHRVDRAHDRRHVRAEPARRPRASTARCSCADGDERGQSAAVTLGVRRALADGIERVLCIPGDCPALDPAELDALLAAHAAGADDATQVVIVPDRHGTGTNGLLLTPPDAIAPSFGPDSCERHRALALAAGVSCRVERPALAAARHRHRRGPRRPARPPDRRRRPGRAHARRARPGRTPEHPLDRQQRLSGRERIMASLRARALSGLPELRAGDDLAALIADAAHGDEPLRDGQLVVIAHKAVSKCEGAVVALADVQPERARARARRAGRSRRPAARSAGDPGGARRVRGDRARRARRARLPHAPRLRLRQRRRRRLQRRRSPTR